VFVTAQGSPYARLRRGLRDRNLPLAVDAAGQLPQVSLADALDLCLLLVEQGAQGRFERAAARWVGRLAVEARLELAEAQLAAAALAMLRGERAALAVETLASLLERRGLADAAIPLRRWRP
jgi:hypothetical protein